MTTKPRVMFATPFYHETCSFNYFISMMFELRALNAAGYDVDYHPTIGDAVNRQRNWLAAIFLESACDPLVFVDSDMGFRAVDVQRMIEADLPVVVANYPKRRFFFDASVNGEWTNGDQLRDALLQGTALAADNPATCRGMTEVEYGGTGLMVIKRQVFADIIQRGLAAKLDNVRMKPSVRPFFHRFFEFSVTAAGHAVGAQDDLGEDWTFCDKAKACGHKIWCDLNAVASHAGMYAFTGSPRLMTRPKQPTTKEEQSWHGHQAPAIS